MPENAQHRVNARITDLLEKTGSRVNAKSRVIVQCRGDSSVYADSVETCGDDVIETLS
jgi:hypothetical protein